MKPYVYIIQNKDRTLWYVGYKQKPKAGEDYWGSSKYLKKLIEQTGKGNWTKTIVAEFDTWQEAKAHEDELLELMWDWPGRVNKAVNGYIDHSDPEVKVKHKAATTISNKKKAQDPRWIAKNKAANQSNFQDPEFKAKHQAGIEKRSEDPAWLANVGSANKKKAKPFIATSIATGEEFCCESLYCDRVKALGLNKGNVSDCLNGKRPQHKGFTFRYV